MIRGVVFCVVLMACGDSLRAGERHGEGAASGSSREHVDETSDETSEGNAAAESATESLATLTTDSYPAIFGVLFDDRVIVQAPVAQGTPLRISAFDVFDGRTIWSAERPGDGLNALIMRFDAEHLLVRVGQKLELLSVQDGQVMASYDFTGQGRQRLTRKRGVCVLEGDCTVDVIDCETAQPLRSLEIGRPNRRHVRPGASSENRCIGGAEIVGRSQNTLILSMRDWRTELARPTRRQSPGVSQWVGIDGQTGDVLWHEPHHCGGCDNAHVGAAGANAWFADDESVTVIDGATGSVRHRIQSDGLRYVFQLNSEPPALQVLRSSAVDLIDLARARHVRSREIPAGSFAVMEGAVFPDGGHWLLRSETNTTFQWLNSQGAPTHTEPLPTGASPRRGAHGQRWTVGSEQTHDDTGVAIRATPFEIHRIREPTGDEDGVRVTLGTASIAEYESATESLGESSRGSAHVITLFQFDENWQTDAQVHVLRVNE